MLRGDWSERFKLACVVYTLCVGHATFDKWSARICCVIRRGLPAVCRCGAHTARETFLRPAFHIENLPGDTGRGGLAIGAKSPSRTYRCPV